MADLCVFKSESKPKNKGKLYLTLELRLNKKPKSSNASSHNVSKTIYIRKIELNRKNK